jgi:predicted ATP-grasp superfamily ATP-dependent carboligase
VSRIGEVLDLGIEVMVCELVPGPDNLLSSYYTYVDNDGNRLFEFTKRVIRRSPVNFGPGCYHITDWAPETAEVGRRFFRGIDFKGLGNVEFKFDQRDGQLKLIECNARFTAAQELLLRSGMDIAWVIYNHITGGQVPTIDRFESGLRLWYASHDFDAFRELHKQGELSILGWIRSIGHPQVVPFFALDDPMPALVKGWRTFRRRILRRPR